MTVFVYWIPKTEYSEYTKYRQLCEYQTIIELNVLTKRIFFSLFVFSLFCKSKFKFLNGLVPENKKLENKIIKMSHGNMLPRWNRNQNKFTLVSRTILFWFIFFFLSFILKSLRSFTASSFVRRYFCAILWSIMFSLVLILIWQCC